MVIVLVTPPIKLISTSSNRLTLSNWDCYYYIDSIQRKFYWYMDYIWKFDNLTIWIGINIASIWIVVWYFLAEATNWMINGTLRLVGKYSKVKSKQIFRLLFIICFGVFLTFWYFYLFWYYFNCFWYVLMVLIHFLSILAFTFWWFYRFLTVFNVFWFKKEQKWSVFFFFSNFGKF